MSVVPARTTMQADREVAEVRGEPRDQPGWPTLVESKGPPLTGRSSPTERRASAQIVELGRELGASSVRRKWQRPAACQLIGNGDAERTKRGSPRRSYAIPRGSQRRVRRF